MQYFVIALFFLTLNCFLLPLKVHYYVQPRHHGLTSFSFYFFPCLPYFLLNCSKFLSYEQWMTTFSPFFDIWKINVDPSFLIMFPFPFLSLILLLSPFYFTYFLTVVSFHFFPIFFFFSSFTSLSYTLNLTSKNIPLRQALTSRETCNCRAQKQTEKRRQDWRSPGDLQDRISVS